MELVNDSEVANDNAVPLRAEERLCSVLAESWWYAQQLNRNVLARHIDAVSRPFANWLNVAQHVFAQLEANPTDNTWLLASKLHGAIGDAEKILRRMPLSTRVARGTALSDALHAMRNVRNALPSLESFARHGVLVTGAC